MKKINAFLLILTIAVSFQSCDSTKVITAWKASDSIVETFETKNVLVIARTSNTQSRIAFETEIADALRAKGIKATESFTKAPEIHPEKEMTDERMAFIKSIIASEGFNAVVLTVIKDKTQTVTETTDNPYMGMGYGYGGFPGYYGGFYNYYRQPYAYGSYYSGFGGYSSTSTYVSTDYILETVAYNLDEPSDKQLVAVVTSKLNDPNNAHKAAAKIVPRMMYSLEKLKN